MEKAMMVVALGNDYDTTRAAGLKARAAGINGVEFVDFNYTNNRLTVRFDPDRASLTEIKDLVERERKNCARSVAKPASGIKYASMGEGDLREGEHVCSE
jgi:hypothetical protein